MILKQCFATKNRCYKAAEKATVTGIVVHSTGANNPELRRYVQPAKGDANYDAVIADLGVNKLGNSWNTSLISKCCHAFIGKNANGVVETYQILPWDYCCWGCGKSSKGSYNYNPQARVQFEICEDNLKNEAYFNAAMKEAIEFCAYIAKMYGFRVDKISSHKEAHAAGYASNHADIDHWLVKYGKDMNWFRAEVKKLLDAEKPKEKRHRCQVGAYGKKANAEAMLAKLKAEGFKDAYITYDGKYYRCQVGSFANKKYAEALKEKLKAKGFTVFIKTVMV